MTFLPRFSRALAAVGLISFALTSFAATTTSIATISSATTDGTASSSTFQLSVTSGQLANALTTSSDIELSLALAPQASHRGLKASVYTVIVAGGKFFKLTEDGSYAPWNGTVEDLTPFTMEKGKRYTNRYVDGSDKGQNSVKIDPATLKRSTFGTKLVTSHVHTALREYLGLENKTLVSSFPFNDDQRFNFFS